MFAEVAVSAVQRWLFQLPRSGHVSCPEVTVSAAHHVAIK